MLSDYQFKFFMYLNKYLHCDHSVSLVTIATLFFDCVLFTFLLDRQDGIRIIGYPLSH